MRVIIAGSRDITDYYKLCEVIDKANIHITEVVCGGARGVDSLGKRWAKDNNIPVMEFPANWNRYGKSAGYIRNAEMANYADALLALWDGNSRGTKHMIDTAISKGLHVCTCVVNEDGSVSFIV